MADITFGVDIGGTGIKGAPVDLAAGRLAAPRQRIATPQPATPAAVAGVVADLVAAFDFTGAIGCTFPAVIKSGVAQTAANVDPAWVGTSVDGAVSAALQAAGRTVAAVTAVNDADAAGVAEMAFGAGRDLDGVVVMLTLGTGIGSAVFCDRVLLPNTELGHLELDGKDAEKSASAVARERHELSWKKWAKILNNYLEHLENLLWPDLVILGGGISKEPDKWLPLLSTRTRLVPATLANDAGIVGAALLARQHPSHATRLDAARAPQTPPVAG